MLIPVPVDEPDRGIMQTPVPDSGPIQVPLGNGVVLVPAVDFLSEVDPLHPQLEDIALVHVTHCMLNSCNKKEEFKKPTF